MDSLDDDMWALFRWCVIIFLCVVVIPSCIRGETDEEKENERHKRNEWCQKEYAGYKLPIHWAGEHHGCYVTFPDGRYVPVDTVKFTVDPTKSYVESENAQ